MPPTGAPIQELPIITTENGIKSIYAFHLDLKQLDLGYQLPDDLTKGRPLAPHHLHVYADTVELAEHLVLPGKNVGIFARRVKLTKSASIDVTGPSAKDNYKPGDLPQQKDMNRGAKGSPGAPDDRASLQRPRLRPPSAAFRQAESRRFDEQAPGV
jgi:hypothetical protein